MDEGTSGAGCDREFADRDEMSRRAFERASEARACPGRRWRPSVVTRASDPRNNRAVVEAQDQFGAATWPRSPVDECARLSDVLTAQRHEVDEGRRARRASRIPFPGSGCCRDSDASLRASARGSDDPMAIVGRAEQGRKACAGIEARPTQPIDRTVATDESGGLAVADQGVVFDTGVP